MAWTLTTSVLLAALLATPAAVTAARAPTTATVSFLNGTMARLKIGSALFVAKLEPDPDTAGRSVVVDLVLRRAGALRGSSNLVEPAGIWHGLEPYSFAADDMRNGAERSVFGAVRVIPIRGTRTRLQVVVADVAVSCAADCAFERLRLQLDPIPGGGPR